MHVLRVAGLLFLVAGCRPEAPSATGNANANSAGAPTTRPALSLRETATKLWEARVSKDCEKVYACLTDAERKEYTVEDFCDYWNNREPFVYEAYEITDVAEEGDFGWVHVEYRSSMRRAPLIPPRDARMWEKWRRLDHAWQPVPRDQLPQYPESPANRDPERERRLRARVALLFEARQQRNFEAAWELTDPHDREEVPKDEFLRQEALFFYDAARLQWAQVMGTSESGKTRAAYDLRWADPNMLKAPAFSRELVETWVWRDNEWFYDLKPTS